MCALWYVPDKREDRQITTAVSPASFTSVSYTHLEGRKRKVYYVNTMAYHMLGYTREEFIEKVQDGWSRFVDIDLRTVYDYGACEKYQG